MRTARAGLLLLLGAAAPGLGMAAGEDGAEARLSWSLGFGGSTQELHSSYSLALAYRSPEIGAPALSLLDLSVSREASVARLAGLPVAWRDYRANQTDDPIAYSSSPLTWVWWAASGIALTAYAIKLSNDDDPAPQGTGGSGG